jgi:DNA-directed RNA polymerase specialized sigma24 family protein
MRTRSDPPSVGNTDEEALRRFVACRDAGDGDAAARAWGEVVELIHDRIVNLVDLEARPMSIDRDEREDIVQAVHLNAWRYWRTFDGTAMGQLHKSLRKMAHDRCVDHVRVAVRHDAESLDARSWEPGDEDRRPHDGEIEAAWEEHLQEESSARVDEFLEWALPQLDPRQRTAWLDARDGVDAEATMVKLRVTQANLYQLRRRALLKLQTLHREFFS